MMNISALKREYKYVQVHLYSLNGQNKTYENNDS